MDPLRRVVVTGIGLVTPLGIGTKTTWSRLIEGVSGIVSTKTLKSGGEGPSFADLPSQVAAVVPKGTGPGEWNDAIAGRNYRDSGKLTPFMLYAMSAAEEALSDSGWTPETDEQRTRTGVCVGTGVGSFEEMITTVQSFTKQGVKKVSPFFVPKVLYNLAAGHISMRYGFMGPNHSVSTACATGAHSIGDAMRFIQFGDADVMLAGASEAGISPLSMAGFSRAKSLSTKYNDRPTESSRPFDRDRDGFVIGEGAGMIVLEEYEHAKRRGANIYAEIRGYGLSGDAFHYTAPPDDGRGAARAMRRALEIGGLGIGDIDYINAHATSTPQGDLAETRGIKSVFGELGAKDLKVSSTKGAIGHLLGAAGAVEAIFTILAIYHDVIPPTLNLHNVDPPEEFSLDYVPLVARDMRTAGGRGVQAGLSNSFGFGGTNCSLAFSKVK